MKKRNLIIGAVVLVGIFMLVNSPRKESKQAIAIETISGKDMTTKQLYSRASGLRRDGEVVRARAIYQKILTEHSDFSEIERVQEELEDLNMKLIFSATPVPGKTVIHEVVPGDTLGALSKEYGVPIELIKRSNGLVSNIIRVGQNLRIWTGTFDILIDKSQNILILKDGDDVLKVYTVSTGKDNSTPIGEFKITSRLVDPVWFNKGIVVPPESPQNVLGSRWLGFDLPGYGIHGTIEPKTIGRQETAGCIRMRNEEVEELYSIVPRGTQVVIVD